ncbi:Stf0 family sulfotransferase [Maricaulis maris]|jgi:LPS sulfotransferase NodH|uniref:Stf0 family sulfotransferase n=1 Tax=Maricaulis maris TaxID=74318 RepID=UPI0026EC38B0|nr:Stf0 family sulfotransferase [Maricaulis maris]
MTDNKFNPITKFFGDKVPQDSELPLDLSGAFADAGIKKAYVIMITGRCGSTWLAHMLKDAGVGVPMEYFNEQSLRHYTGLVGADTIEDFFAKSLQEFSANSTFGFKINPTRLFWLGAKLDIDRTLVRGGVEWIDMRRNNIVKQAISFTRAQMTGAWHQIRGEGEQDETVELPQSIFDDEYSDIRDNIWKNIRNIVQQERSIDQFYANRNMKPMRLLYEDLLDSRASVFSRVVTQILGSQPEDAGISLPETKTIKIATEEQWELDMLRRFPSEIESVYRNR